MGFKNNETGRCAAPGERQKRPGAKFRLSVLSSRFRAGIQQFFLCCFDVLLDHFLAHRTDDESDNVSSGHCQQRPLDRRSKRIAGLDAADVEAGGERKEGEGGGEAVRHWWLFMVFRLQAADRPRRGTKILSTK